MQIVTGYTGGDHINPSMDGARIAGIIGADNYVLQVGEQFRAEVITANTVRVYDGDLIINGRQGRIAPDSYAATA